MLELAYKKLDAFSAKVDTVVSAVLGMVVLVMFASLMAQVVCRYLFNKALPWPEEVTMLLMAYMSFLGSSVALRRWGHIGVDYFLNKFTGRKHHALLLFIRVLTLIFCLFLVIQGSEFAFGSGNMLSDGLRIPMTYPRLAVPLGGVLMTLYTVTFILKDLLNLRDGGNAHGI